MDNKKCQQYVVDKEMLNFLLKALFFCILGALLTNCSNRLFSSHTEYITRQSLASYRVGTPDPTLDHPVLGQRMFIKWSLPNEYLDTPNMHFEVVIRFRNLMEQEFSMPIYRLSGLYVFNLNACDFLQTGGILTYKIDLVGGDCVLDQWRHQLWVDLIRLNSDNQDTPNDLSADNADKEKAAGECR